MPDIETRDAHLQLSELRDQVREQRRKALSGALVLAADAHRSRDAADKLEFALGRVEQLDKRLDTLSSVSVISEPDLYSRGGEHSFFKDIVATSGIPVHHVSGIEASKRLERHARYEQTEAGRRAEVAHRKLSRYGIEARSAGQTAQARALSIAAGAGGELVPPKWIVEEWASVSRAACPLKGLVTRLDLPDGTMDLVVPRFDSSAGVVPMQAENINAPDEFSGTDQITAPVATFAGEVILSQAMFDRGGHFSDEIALREFAEAYAASLAQQLTSGTGQNGQILGLLNVPASADGVPGAIMTTYTDTTPTPKWLALTIAQCTGEIGDTRERPPSVCLMRPSRWAWLSGWAWDSSDETAVRPGTGNMPEDFDLGPFGPLPAGTPVYLDATLPTNVAGAGQDVIVLVRARDVLLLEDPAGPRFNAYPSGVEAGQLTVVLGWHHYTAAITDRYPSAIGTVQGTGLTLPTGF
jgi:HK97 family phage major capsid protein